MKILVATDGSKCALHAVKYAATLAEQMSGASLTLISVHDDAGLRHAKSLVGKEEVADYLRTRKMGDMIVVDAHIEVDASISVEAGHDIAVAAQLRVLQRHKVINMMTHVDPWRRPDLDHRNK